MNDWQRRAKLKQRSSKIFNAVRSRCLFESRGLYYDSFLSQHYICTIKPRKWSYHTGKANGLSNGGDCPKRRRHYQAAVMADP